MHAVMQAPSEGRMGRDSSTYSLSSKCRLRCLPRLSKCTMMMDLQLSPCPGHHLEESVAVISLFFFRLAGGSDQTSLASFFSSSSAKDFNVPPSLCGWRRSKVFGAADWGLLTMATYGSQESTSHIFAPSQVGWLHIPEYRALIWILLTCSHTWSVELPAKGDVFGTPPWWQFVPAGFGPCWLDELFF